MYVNPSTEFEAVAQFETGLTGTLGVRITDNAGNTTLPRATAGISEYPAGSGIYAITLTSPGTAGQYSIVWDDGAAEPAYAIEDLVVTAVTLSVTIGAGNLYVTRDDLKALLKYENETYADEAIDLAVAAASRAIDGYKGTRFYAATETRYFTAVPGSYSLAIDDLVSATSVTVDTDGDGVYETTWVEGTDFELDPPNAALDGQPKRRLVIAGSSGFTYWNGRSWEYDPDGATFPRFDRAIKITGSFGWAAVPAVVKQAAVLLANRLLARTTRAPFGILVQAAGDTVAAARLGRIDPDIAFLLDSLPGAARRLLV